MTIITVSRAATPDEISAEMDRRGAVIEKLETDLRHWREECGKLHSQLDAAEEKLRLANTGSLSLLYDIRRALGWNDKTSLSILADGVRGVRRILATWDTPTDMELKELARLTIERVRDLEQVNEDNKRRIEELLEELAGATEEEDDRLRCDQCDNRVIAGWHFCPYCGRPQTDEEIEAAQRELTARQKQQETIYKLSEQIAAMRCEDCPPDGYQTDATRCRSCPRRTPEYHAGAGVSEPLRR